MVEEKRDDTHPLPLGGRSDPEVVSSHVLLKGHREIWIEHDGVRYRLRVTRRNKLILQK
jgi:hemin uptake protein HemP